MGPEAVIEESIAERKVCDAALRARLLATLYTAQEQHGYLSPKTLQQVAEQLGLTLSQVYSTASFYTLFHTRPVGHYVIQVCQGLSCYLNEGAEKVVDYISAKLGIKPGETTSDGCFTLLTVQCLGSCGTAPTMRVNDELYENLTPESIDRILEQLREGRR